jgi:molybdopterin/thiamine biosynthesis adenylyltransferase
MKWAIQNPARFLAERTGIEELSNEAWLSDVRWRFGTALRVEFDVAVGTKKFELVLTYPDFFPDTPAFIRPRDFSSRISLHQYGAGGSLCLEYRPDNWHSGVTGADLIRSAYRLLSSENVDNAPPVPSAHNLTLGQRLRGEPERFVCTSALMDLLKLVRPGNGLAAVGRTIVHGNERVVFISQLEDASGKSHYLRDQPIDEDTFGPVFTFEGEARVFRVHEADRKASIESLEAIGKVIGQPATLEALFPKSVQSDENKTKRYFILLHGDNAPTIRAFRILPGETTHVIELAVIPAEKLEERLPSEHKRLESLRVAIVGLGSIGSKVAVSLARSGVRKFLLIDDDFLLPANLRRNELSWMGVGVHKALAVKELIHLVAPECRVAVKIHRIGGQESARDAAALLDDIASCDLILDATADPEVFVTLAAIARRNKKPLCWGELFAGGVGGLIARARPDADPSPLAVRTAVLDFLNKQPPAPYQTAVAYDMDELRPLTAYDADVGHIAAALTRFSIDALLNRTGGVFPYAAYIIGLRKEWIFAWPFDVHPIDVRGIGWDSQLSDSEEDQRAVLDFLLSLAADGRG